MVPWIRTWFVFGVQSRKKESFNFYEAKLVALFYMYAMKATGLAQILALFLNHFQTLALSLARKFGVNVKGKKMRHGRKTTTLIPKGSIYHDQKDSIVHCLFEYFFSFLRN